jgi:hypothetical protein
LAGIVTRDSIILWDFIHLSLAKGRTLFDAIWKATLMVRLRPILLRRYGPVVGLAHHHPISIRFLGHGLFAEIFGSSPPTIFTVFVIPVTYCAAYAISPPPPRTPSQPGHGLPQAWGVADGFGERRGNQVVLPTTWIKSARFSRQIGAGVQPSPRSGLQRPPAYSR